MSEEETVTTTDNVDEQDSPEATEEAAQTEPETTSTEDADSETASEDKAEKPVKTPEQKRIAKQARDIREMKRQNARMTKMLETQIETASKAPSESKAPKIENFESMDEYLDARDKHRDKPSEAKPEPVNNDFMDARNELFAYGSEKYDDFEDVVLSHQSVTQMMAAALLEIDDPDLQADVAYFLGNNPKDARKISKLSETRQIAEIAKLEVKLSAKPAKKKVSQAPKPIKPVGGSKTSSDEIRDGEEFESFRKKRNKQLGRN